MKNAFALSLYSLALAGPASVSAVVTVWAEETVVVTVTAPGPGPSPVNEKIARPPPQAVSSSAAPPPPPPASSSAPPPPPPASSSAPPAPASSSAAASGGSPGTPGSLKSSDSKICINFSGNDNFHWLNTGAWGSNSGIGTQSASQCFDLSPNSGMFICENECQDSGDSATAKYTKLECTFGGGYQNCDISLVDGFSLPLQCTIPGAKPQESIGGLVDLQTLTDCPTKGEDNTCKNANAYMSQASDVSEFFQKADYGVGGNYCVFQFCGPQSDTFFTGTPTIECKVGYPGGKATKRDVVGAIGDVFQRDGASHLKSHRHKHGHAHAHARGLKDVVA